MKLLILNHHFQQDIDALLAANSARHEVRTISPHYFADAALPLFPEPVWGAEFAAYHAPELTDARLRYRAVAHELLFDLYTIYPFDAFVSPSDTFFYVRDVIDACHALSTPFIVVQKETGVATSYLKDEAAATLKWFPFAGDWMTTSSERSLEYWCAAGARRDQVSVVGQPRYDFYRQPEVWTPLERLGVRVERRGTTILFLSYNFDAYDEKRGVATHRPWEQLHRQTEEALCAAGARGCTVLIKPHPQQDKGTLNEIAQRLAGRPGVTIVASDIDTRQLIVASNIVVGFQTTGLAEAMAAGKRVIYTFWTDAVERAKDGLLPFHEMGDCIEVARSRDDLDRHLWSDEATTGVDRRMELVAPYLGTVDGHASSRVWSVIEEVVRKFAAPDSTQVARRSALEARAPSFCRSELRRARQRLAVRALAAAVVGTGHTGLRGAAEVRLHDRLEREFDRVTELRDRMTQDFRPVSRLIGRTRENLMKAGLGFSSRWGRGRGAV